jgi:hypothetical protein
VRHCRTLALTSLAIALVWTVGVVRPAVAEVTTSGRDGSASRARYAGYLFSYFTGEALSANLV